MNENRPVSMSPGMNAALIKTTLLDIAAQLVKQGLTARVDHQKAEIRAGNPETGIGQQIAVGTDNGAILVYWVWETPAAIPETLGELMAADSELTATDEALLDQIRDELGADPRGSVQRQPAPPVRTYEPIGIAWTDVAGIARRVRRVLRPAEDLPPNRRGDPNGDIQNQ